MGQALENRAGLEERIAVLEDAVAGEEPESATSSALQVRFDGELRDTLPIVTLFGSLVRLPRWARGLLTVS